MRTGKKHAWVFSLICIALSIAISPTSAFGVTINVPSAQYPTIQTGIDAAVDGDTVLVADGTYTGDGNKNLDFKGKAITLISQNGPNNTVIDCEGDGRGFYFHTGEGENSVLSGFTITNGQADFGGGIACFNSSPTITDCIVTENDAQSLTPFDGMGGGIYCETSSPIINNSIIRKNSAAQFGGGIASQNGSSPSITDCSIIENNASMQGMGVYSRESSLSFIRCTIQDNYSMSTAGDGGGIYCYDSNTIIDSCVIRGHRVGSGGGIHCSGGTLEITDSSISENEGTNVPNYGGGIHCTGTNVNITGCTISQNTAGGGGGIYCNNSTINISQCVITENQSTQFRSDGYGGGGGIFCPDSTGSIISSLITKNSAVNGGGVSSDGTSPNIINCTISQNSASGDRSGSNPPSGAIYIRNSSPIIANCIFWDNSPGEIFVDGGSPAVTYSTVQNGWLGEGNISVNPKFVDPINDNYHLADYSPCIGAGTSDGAPASDIEGNSRPDPFSSNPDIGAYENSRGTPDIPPPDIFGIEIGNSWTYQGTSQAETYSWQKEVVSLDETTFSPISTYVVEYTSEGSSAGKDWLEKSASDLKLWGERDVYGDFYGYLNGLINAWYPMQVGDQRYSTATTFIEGYAFTASLTADVLALETVNLGFDAFDTYKVRYRARVWGHGVDVQTEFYYWVLPYIGFVKYQDGDATEMLTSFAIGGGTVTDQTDADNDGLKDYEELIIYASDWQNIDTDDDGLGDGEEVLTYGTDPADADSDNDGLNDGDEVNTHGTDPTSEDTDNDGLSDFEELITHNTDPTNADSDGDELNDGDEIAIGTDPNDSDTDGDGMPDGWEDEYGLNPLTNDAGEDPDKDGLTNYQEYERGRHPTNVEPDKPELYLPADGEPDVSPTAELETGPFRDSDEHDHYLTQWQIGKQIDGPQPCTEESFTNPDYKVFDGTSDKQLTLFNVPDMLLDVDTGYCWRARFTDTGDATSEWADPFVFSTILQSEEDQDPRNGIPDDQEADCLGIFDPDAMPQDTACVNALVANAQIGIEPGAGVTSIDAFRSVDPQDIPENLSGVELLIGLMSFKAQVNQEGEIMELTFHSSEPMPVAAKCYKYDPINGWQDYSEHIVAISADRKSITLEYKDGGFGDLDGVENRIIIDPVGFGVAAAGSSGSGSASGGGGGGGGGGCLISTAAAESGASKDVLLIVLILGAVLIGVLQLVNRLKK